MKPKGFWSYARGDDEHLDQMLSELRERIAGEVSMLMGQDIGIFQDIHDLRTGDLWAEELRKGLNKASFLIPVLTPRFFNRPWCREEVLTYLRLSQEAGLEPRIFPVKFVEWDDDDSCEVRAALQPFQYKDLSNWRFESDPTQKNRLVYEFGKDVKARLKLPVVAKAEAAKAAKPEVRAPEGSGQATAARDAPPPPKQKVHVVDAWPKRGDFSSIQAAIDAAEPGDRIVVREGTYRESLQLSKVLEIVGEGDREKILVVTSEGDALHCDAPLAKVSGMRFRCEAGGDGFGIEISAGAAEFEDCVIESQALSCVVVAHDGSTPTLRRCEMRDAAEGGLLITDGAQPIVEECKFSKCGLVGVEIRGATTRATLRRCAAERSKKAGFVVHSAATAIFESCEARGNSEFGLIVRQAASVLFREGALSNNQASGVLVCGWATVRIERVRVTSNGHTGAYLFNGAAPELVNCEISGNRLAAVLIEDAESGGVFRDNDLRGNKGGAWNIVEGAKVERSGNLE